MIQKLVAILSIPDLRRKLLLTAVLLAVYRLGFWVPLPIVNQARLKETIDNVAQGQGGALGQILQTASSLELLLAVATYEAALTLLSISGGNPSC